MNLKILIHWSKGVEMMILWSKLTNQVGMDRRRTNFKWLLTSSMKEMAISIWYWVQISNLPNQSSYKMNITTIRSVCGFDLIASKWAKTKNCLLLSLKRYHRFIHAFSWCSCVQVYIYGIWGVTSRYPWVCPKPRLASTSEI